MGIIRNPFRSEGRETVKEQLKYLKEEREQARAATLPESETPLPEGVEVVETKSLPDDQAAYERVLQGINEFGEDGKDTTPPRPGTKRSFSKN